MNIGVLFQIAVWMVTKTEDSKLAEFTKVIKNARKIPKGEVLNLYEYLWKASANKIKSLSSVFETVLEFSMKLSKSISSSIYLQQNGKEKTILYEEKSICFCVTITNLENDYVEITVKDEKGILKFMNKNEEEKKTSFTEKDSDKGKNKKAISLQKEERNYCPICKSKKNDCFSCRHCRNHFKIPKSKLIACPGCNHRIKEAKFTVPCHPI